MVWPAGSTQAAWAPAGSIDWQNRFARAIKPKRVVPIIGNRDAIRNLAIAAAKLNGDLSIRILLCGEIVERIGVKRVRKAWRLDSDVSNAMTGRKQCQYHALFRMDWKRFVFLASLKENVDTPVGK